MLYLIYQINSYAYFLPREGRTCDVKFVHLFFMMHVSKAIFLFVIGFGLMFSSCKSKRAIVKNNTHSTSEHHEAAKLKSSIQTWIGVPYKYGGNDKQGVDCSGFVCAIYQSVYGIQLPRTSKQQFEKSIKIKQEHLKQGDLVFFNPNTKNVSHVGIYMGRDSFAHASTSKGVVMSSLKTTYYKNCFMGGGRFN